MWSATYRCILGDKEIRMCVENGRTSGWGGGWGEWTPSTCTSQALVSIRDIRIYQKMIKVLTGFVWLPHLFWHSFDILLTGFKKRTKKANRGFYPRGIFWGRGRSFHVIGKSCHPLWVIDKAYHLFLTFFWQSLDILLTGFWHFVWPFKKSLLSLYWGNLPGGERGK